MNNKLILLIQIEMCCTLMIKIIKIVYKIIRYNLIKRMLKMILWNCHFQLVFHIIKGVCNLYTKTNMLLKSISILSKYIIDQLFNDLSYDPRFSLMNTNNVSNYYNENEKEYYLTMDVPGMSKDDIEVTFDSNRLKISGQRKSDKYDSYEYGKMERTFSVPSNVETDKISAKIDNGVLKVLLPKAKSSLGRKISVK